MKSVVGRHSSGAIATRCGLQGTGIESQPVLVAQQSQARICGRTLAGIAGSNPAGGMDVCVLYSKYKRQEARTVRTKKYR